MATACAPASSRHRRAYCKADAPLLFGIVLRRGGPIAALWLSSTLMGLSFLALFVLAAPQPR
jgi:hypothetical protein